MLTSPGFFFKEANLFCHIPVNTKAFYDCIRERMKECRKIMIEFCDILSRHSGLPGSSQFDVCYIESSNFRFLFFTAYQYLRVYIKLFFRHCTDLKMAPYSEH